MELERSTKLMFNNFIDEMFNQLAKPYTTSNNEVIYIKVNRATVTNIARAFARARLLDVNLARKTQGFYVEPESVAKILAENCIRPASWTKNEAGIPTQYPC